MEKIELRKSLEPLYGPPAGRLVDIDVPRMRFVKVDDHGDPDTAPAYRSAVEWLHAVSYALKLATKAALGRDLVVPPLEGLWWAGDPAAFVRRVKGN